MVGLFGSTWRWQVNSGAKCQPILNPGTGSGNSGKAGSSMRRKDPVKAKVYLFSAMRCDGCLGARLLEKCNRAAACVGGVKN
ncbi:hypothetical protein FH972_023666 [Carpinus fangiana]|uniref:Uncharacterized protein n=1 Tax=Carpinus fangiana TaxID=176857 RepID=A0A5N6KW44_9ROSI|nr:hypothetical protein FH972_023666 [Carpinus fangiana]